MERIKSKKSKKLNKIFTWIIFALALISGSAYGIYKMVKADDVLFEKNVEVDTDGTYKVSLAITGSADTTTTESKANVLIVYDTSGSMHGHLPYQYGSYGHTSTYQSEGWVQLYKNTGSAMRPNYVAITDAEQYTGTLYRRNDYGSGYTTYTGDRFYSYSRAEKAEATVHDFADALLGHNTNTSPNNVQMALVTFASVGTQVRFGSGSSASYWTSNKTQFLDQFSSASETQLSQTYDGLTNWEQALKKAVSTLGSADSDPTFVVFVTDGAPNLRDLGDNHRYTNSDKISNYNAYDYAKDEARTINTYKTTGATEANTKLYGIYAFGTEADYLDDLLYYAQNNAHRPASAGGVTDATVATPSYFKADTASDLETAIRSIFTDIANTLGVKQVSMHDGTTNEVSVSSGSMNAEGMVNMVPNSFKYYLTIKVTGNGPYTFKKTDPLTGEELNITVTDKGNGKYDLTWTTEDGNNHSVTNLNGSVSGNLSKEFTFEWTGSNEFYPLTVDVPEATYNNGAVDWNLSSVGTLLDGVTYTVTFNLYPTQSLLDLVADVKNGLIDYGATTYKDGSGKTVNPKVWTYLTSDMQLKTNTDQEQPASHAYVSYNDTRDDLGVRTEEFEPQDPVGVVSVEQMAVTKEWPNDVDQRPHDDSIALGINKDNAKYIDLVLGESNHWQEAVTASVGMLTIHDGNVAILSAGHDYSFSEDVGLTHHWELSAPTVHPMIINGTATMLVLVTDDGMDDVPAALKNSTKANDVSGDYYKFTINDTVKYYKVDNTVANLTAYNYRRSVLDVKKIVTGKSAPEDSKFLFTFNVTDSSITTPSENGDDIWFSVHDENNTPIFDLTVTGATAEGYRDVNTADTDHISDVSIDGDLLSYRFNGGELNTVLILEDLGNGVYRCNPGFYYARNGSTFTVELKAGYDLRVINLPTGSSYTVTETSSTPSVGYNLVSVVDEAGHSSQNSTYSGTIEEANKAYTVTYTNEYTKTSVPVTKAWDDNSDQDGLRPDEDGITLILTGGESDITKTIKPGDDGVTVSEDGNSWMYTFADLPAKDSNGNEYEYSVDEASVPEGYRKIAVAGDALTGYIITNKHTPETDSVTVNKVWSDNSDQDGLRPDEVTLILYADGVEVGRHTVDATSGDTQSYTFPDLPVYKEHGTEIVYTVDEAEVNTDDLKDYEKSINNDTLTVTNSYTPETDSVTVTKVWSDGSDQDGLRPDEVTLILYADNVEVGRHTVDATSGDTQSYTFPDLPVYKDHGTEIVYTVDEAEVNADDLKDYEKSIDNDTLTVTNSYTPETDSVTVTKVWSDNSDQDGLRPDEVTLILYADGVEVGRQNVDATDGDTQSYTFMNLPVYHNHGTPIVYTVDETEVEEDDLKDYEKSINNDTLTVTNSYTPETDSVTVTKVWSDNSDQDGLRPDEVTLILYADGVEVGRQNVDATSGDSQSYTFPDLPVYKDHGTEIVYTVDEAEVNTDDLKDYTKNINNDTLTVTNSYTPETRNIIVKKVWNDNLNQDGVRPIEDGIWITLLDGGEAIADTRYNLKPGADGVIVSSDETTWTYTYVAVPVYKDHGTPIVYTVTEDAVTNYSEVSYTSEGENTLVITNSYTPETTPITVTKVWADNSDQDGVRPDTITLILYADGNVVGRQTINATNGDSQSYTFPSLPVYRDGGTAIVYTVDEAEVNTDDLKDYEKSINNNTLTVTNSHTAASIDIPFTKIWSDNDDQDGIRPNDDGITVRLLADGVEVDSQQVYGSGDTWSGSFTGKPQYKEHGTEIIYTVSEDRVTGYSTNIVDNTITNTHTPELISVSGVKAWADSENIEGFRPIEDGVTVRLYADGVEIDSQVVKGDGEEWAYTFPNLPKYKEHGTPIVYTVTEDQVENYDEPSYKPDQNGNNYIIVNTHSPSDLEITVEKIWEDEPEDGIANIYGHTSELEIKLIGKVGTTTYINEPATLTEDGNWTHTFTELPEYREGMQVAYSVDEINIKDYDKEITSTVDENTGKITFTITNTYHPEEYTEINGTKTWADDGDREGLRPDSIVINVYDQFDNKVASKTVTEDDKWEYEFRLPKYGYSTEVEDYVELEYRVTEEAVDGYETEVSGYDVINTHDIATVTFNVTKIWTDGGDNDGMRPDEITVRIIDADTGEEAASAVITAESGWYHAFDALPKYKNGGEVIHYEIVEDEVPGYTYTVTQSDEENSNDYILENTHEVSLIDLIIKKVWDDYDDVSKIRPSQINVDLYADDKLLKSLVITEEDGWEITVSGLHKYNNGIEIEYRVEEEVIPEYETYYAKDGNTFTITNHHELGKGGDNPPEELPPQTGLINNNKTRGVFVVLFNMLSFAFVLRTKED